MKVQREGYEEPVEVRTLDELRERDVVPVHRHNPMVYLDENSEVGSRRFIERSEGASGELIRLHNFDSRTLSVKAKKMLVGEAAKPSQEYGENNKQYVILDAIMCARGVK